MYLHDQATIYAVKAVQPNDANSADWIPILYKEIQHGNARFGWSWFDDADLQYLQSKMNSRGWRRLGSREKEVWKRAAFLLDVQPDDYFVYINMPAYGKCTIAKIKDRYRFGKVLEGEGHDDFRHLLPCEYIATFDRSDDRVPPYLQRRLRLMGAWYRIHARQEFEELLTTLHSGTKGVAPKTRLREKIDARLAEMTADIYRTFPEKQLEKFLLEMFATLPQVKKVQKGPDTNGADLEIEFETGLDISGLKMQHFCAVQAKCYEGELGHTRAIKDVRRAFESNDNYTCGLIVSTALTMTEDFEAQLEALRKESGKDVGVLLGKELAYTFMKSGFRDTEAA